MAGNTGRKLFTPEDAARFFGMDLIKWDDAAMWMVSQLHPDGVFCPSCSTQIVDERQNKFSRFEQIRCSSPGCRKKFTAKTGTLLDGSKLEPREIYLIAVLTNLGVPSARIASVIRCHVDTVTNWQAHFQAQQELSA